MPRSGRAVGPGGYDLFSLLRYWRYAKITTRMAVANEGADDTESGIWGQVAIVQRVGIFELAEGRAGGWLGGVGSPQVWMVTQFISE